MTNMHRIMPRLIVCLAASCTTLTACIIESNPSTDDETSEGDGDGDGDGDPGDTDPGDGDPGDGDGDPGDTDPGDGDPGDGDGDPGDGDPGDGDGDPGDGDPENGDPGDEIRLANTQDDCINGWVAPVLPDEASHLAAAILTPETYPFEVTRLHYALGGPEDMDICNETLGHRVDVFVTQAGPLAQAPSETEPFLSFDVPADPMAGGEREVDIELDDALILEEGEALVVAVEMRSDELDTRLCLALCEPGGGAIEGVDWWSNAAEEPYSWADLVAAFGFTQNIALEAYGNSLDL